MTAFALLVESTTHAWAVAMGIVAGALLGACAMLTACAVWALVDHVAMKRRDRQQKESA